MVAVVAKVIGALLVVVSAYFYGYHQGQNTEELNHARTQITTLERAIEEHKAQQSADAVTMAALRVAESASRNELDRMRQQLSDIERMSKTDAARQRDRCLRLAIRGKELLDRANNAIKFCEQNHR